MKYLIVIALIAAGGYLAWQNLPGLRNTVTQAANQYGGWTEEARRNDPVGFMQHAQDELRSDIKGFEEARDELATNKTNAEANLERFRNEETAASEAANALRELYKSANESNSWPIEWMGQSYSREKLVEQVDQLLADKSNATERQADYQKVLDKVEATRTELRARINDSETALDRLAAQEAMIKVDKLTAEADELLAQVNELVEENAKVAADPVRTVDELVAEAAKQAEAKAASEAVSAAQDFLDS
ncbi:MAG: hypothetical protein AAGA20_17505 [Planctomycetota bacterium]